MSSSIYIIPAEDQHFSIIQSIARDTWPHTFGAILSPQQIEYMLNWMYSIPSIEDQVRRGHVFLLATDGKQYYGYASYEVGYKGSAKVKVHKIYILPSAQGKGVGRLLMDAIAEAGKQHHATHLALNVNRENTAIKFYERYGFEIVASEDIDIGNGYLMEDYVMEKKLGN